MKPRYEHVDALRGIAVLLVFLVHVGHHVPPALYFKNISYYGEYGVQTFFVMSAFTLCHSLKKVKVLKWAEYCAFMIRRFFRIAPMYYLAILFYYIITLESSSNSSGTLLTALDHYTWSNVAANLLFVHGLIPDANNSIVPGGWSIGCEFLFYTFFPSFFFLTLNNKWIFVTALANRACPAPCVQSARFVAADFEVWALGSSMKYIASY